MQHHSATGGNRGTASAYSSTKTRAQGRAQDKQVRRLLTLQLPLACLKLWAAGAHFAQRAHRDNSNRAAGATAAASALWAQPLTVGELRNASTPCRPHRTLRHFLHSFQRLGQHRRPRLRLRRPRPPRGAALVSHASHTRISLAVALPRMLLAWRRTRGAATTAIIGWVPPFGTSATEGLLLLVRIPCSVGTLVTGHPILSVCDRRSIAAPLRR